MDHYIIASFEVTTIGCRNAPKSLTNPNHKKKKTGEFMVLISSVLFLYA